MKQLYEGHVIERAYGTENECNQDTKKMTEGGFRVVSDRHDIFAYYRRFEKQIG